MGEAMNPKELEKKYSKMSFWERQSEKNRLEDKAAKLEKQLNRIRDLSQQIEQIDLELKRHEDDASWCRNKHKQLLKLAGLASA